MGKSYLEIVHGDFFAHCSSLNTQPEVIGSNSKKKAVLYLILKPKIVPFKMETYTEENVVHEPSKETFYIPLKSGNKGVVF